MPTIKIIRAAFREIQKLSPGDSQRVHQILQRLSNGDERHTKALRGFDNLLRTRLGRWRVIWHRDGEDTILVIKAGLRGDVYDDAFDRDRAHPQIIEELLNPQGTELSENPSYQWNYEQDNDWYRFVYGSYRYSPILTHYQRHVLDEPLRLLCSHYEPTDGDDYEDNSCIVIQSAPGTGKTVCATLFACEIHRSFGWNTMLIVPEALQRDISEFDQVKISLQDDTFWLGTLPQWLGKINPDLDSKLASPQQELEALREAMKFTRQGEVSTSDMLLYQAFVLDENNQQQQQKNIMYQANAKRLESLIRISKKHFYKALSCRISRLDAAKLIQSTSNINPTNSECTLLIVDEAQDYLLSELQAIISVCKSWAKQGHQTFLWLLGDLNQRIQPTDFTWGQLHIRNTIELLRNYRNSRQILEFANQFWQVAQEITAKNKCKELPTPANPDDAFENGENVRLLVCETQEEAGKFLNKLAGECGREENRRHLLRDLAKAVKVLATKPLEKHENLVILSPERAKGREFEACVAFCLFAGENPPSLEESFQWYTLLTRARSRLLVVVTKEEVERLSYSGVDYFRKCDRVTPTKAIKWITEVASDAELNQITSDVQERLLKRCESGYLYWDTYLALQLAGVKGIEKSKWELKAISLLAKQKEDHLLKELEKAPTIPLKCLILRALGQSWQAVIMAAPLKNSEKTEYECILKNIANDFERKGLSYEATRVRAYIYGNQCQQKLPFWEQVLPDSQPDQPLVKLLCQAFIAEVKNFGNKEKINQDLNGKW